MDLSIRSLDMLAIANHDQRIEIGEIGAEEDVHLGSRIKHFYASRSSVTRVNSSVIQCCVSGRHR